MLDALCCGALSFEECGWLSRGILDVCFLFICLFWRSEYCPLLGVAGVLVVMVCAVLVGGNVFLVFDGLCVVEFLVGWLVCVYWMVGIFASFGVFVLYIFVLCGVWCLV